MDSDLLRYAFFGLYWVVFIYSIVLHELAHGYSALRMGDSTAWKAGRLSLNPLRHIDPVFSLLMPVLFYMGTGTPWGGAKPVPVNMYLFRSLRWGNLICTAAGPLTNIAIAVFFAMLFLMFRALGHGAPTLTCRFLSSCMLLNVFLAAFNLLPVPPLDGSHIFASLLPRSLWDVWGKIQRLGWIPMVILVAINNMVWPFLGYGLLMVGMGVLHILGAHGNEWLSTISAKNLLGG